MIATTEATVMVFAAWVVYDHCLLNDIKANESANQQDLIACIYLSAFLNIDFLYNARYISA